MRAGCKVEENEIKSAFREGRREIEIKCRETEYLKKRNASGMVRLQRGEEDG